MDINITNPVTTAKIGEVVNGANAATPNDTDLLPIVDTAVTKKITLTNFKAFLKTYFDTLYTGGGSVWGSITGTLSDQTDLQTALNNKEPLKGADDNYVTDAQLTVIQNTSGTNTGDETAARIGAIVNGATNYPTPLDADKIGIWDVANSLFKALTWANLKATLVSTFFLDATSSIQTQLNKKLIPFSGGYNSFSPSDSTSYGFCQAFVSSPTTNITSTVTRPLSFISAGTLKAFNYLQYQSNNGSSETVSIYLRNVTTATNNLIGNFTSDAGVSQFKDYWFTGLNISVNTTDSYMIVIVTPTWATNPTNWFGNYTGYLLA